MKCSSCGKTIRNGDSYCIYCGKAIKKEPTMRKNRRILTIALALVFLLSIFAGLVLSKVLPLFSNDNAYQLF